MNTPVEKLVARLNASRCGKGWIALCPAHPDHMPRLSINEGRDGRALVNCGAGCKTRDVLSAIGLTFRDLFPANSPQQSGNGPVRSAPKPRLASGLDWRGCVTALTAQRVEQLAKWRGYSVDSVHWLKENGIIGLHDDHIAIRVDDRGGNVVGLHYRLKDGSWRYHPQATKVSPLCNR